MFIKKSIATKTTISLRFPAFLDEGAEALSEKLNTEIEPLPGTDPVYKTTMLWAQAMGPDDFLDLARSGAMVQWQPNHFTLLVKTKNLQNHDPRINPIIEETHHVRQI